MTATDVRGYICLTTGQPVDQEIQGDGRWCGGRPPCLHARRPDGAYENARPAWEPAPVAQAVGRVNGAGGFSLPVPPLTDGNEKRESRRTGLSTITLTDLLARPPREQSWLLDGLLVADGTSLWAAKPKCGKSVTLRNLARAVAIGEPFLGRATTSGTVLLVSLEDRESRVRAHFESMGDVEAIGDRIILYIGAAPEHGIAALEDTIAIHRPVLTIVDTVGRLIRFRDINDYAEVMRELGPVGELARRMNCHIALTHHLGKSERVDGGDGVLGSTALFAVVDTLAIVKRRQDGGRSIATLQREGDDLSETLLTLDNKGVVSLGSALSEQLAADAEADVESVLGDEELTEAEIRARAGGNTGLTGRALRQLVAKGSVVRRGSGKRGHPFTYQVRAASERDPEHNEENEQKEHQ
jgi:hypothetical protein